MARWLVLVFSFIDRFTLASILMTVLTLLILGVKAVLASGPHGGPGQQAVGAAPGRLVQGGRLETAHPGLVRNGHQELIQRLLEFILIPSYLTYLFWQCVKQSCSVYLKALFSECLDSPPPPWLELGHLAPPPQSQVLLSRL